MLCLIWSARGGMWGWIVLPLSNSEVVVKLPAEEGFALEERLPHGFSLQTRRPEDLLLTGLVPDDHMIEYFRLCKTSRSLDRIFSILN